MVDLSGSFDRQTALMQEPLKMPLLGTFSNYRLFAYLKFAQWIE